MKRRDLIEIIENLRNAAQDVVDQWSTNHLAEAVNGLEGPIAEADAALEWWKSEED